MNSLPFLFSPSEVEEMRMSGFARLQLLHWDATFSAVECHSASSPAVILTMLVWSLESSCCFYDALQPHDFMMLL